MLRRLARKVVQACVGQLAPVSSARSLNTYPARFETDSATTAPCVVRRVQRLITQYIVLSPLKSPEGEGITQRAYRKVTGKTSQMLTGARSSRNHTVPHERCNDHASASAQLPELGDDCITLDATYTPACDEPAPHFDR